MDPFPRKCWAQIGRECQISLGSQSRMGRLGKIGRKKVCSEAKWSMCWSNAIFLLINFLVSKISIQMSKVCGGYIARVCKKRTDNELRFRKESAKTKQGIESVEKFSEFAKSSSTVVFFCVRKPSHLGGFSLHGVYVRVPIYRSIITINWMVDD